MWRRRLNFANWPISSKLALILALAILLPVLLLAVPVTSQRRQATAQDQHQTRLETLGPFEIAQVDRALQDLKTETERIVTGVSTDQTQLREYLFRAPTALSESQRQQLNAQIEVRVFRFMGNHASMSRLRFYDSRGTMLLDATRQAGQTIQIQYTPPPERTQTPADALIAGEFGRRTSVVTAFYESANGRPTVDVAYALRPLGGIGSSQVTIGYVVFSYDLLLTAADDTIPDLYTVLQSFPQADLPTHVFLLNNAGQLLSPAENFDFMDEAGGGEGFRAAQRGETGVSIYRSALLDTQVMGYHAAVSFRDGPELTFLVETSLDAINEQVAEEGLIEISVQAGSALVIGIATVLVAGHVIARPLSRLTDAAQRIAAGQLQTDLPEMQRQDEIGQLNNAVAQMANQLVSAISDLERRVQARTRNLETTLEVGRAITSIRESDALLEEVVNLIRAQFGRIYHAQVFLIDPVSNQAQLRASTGAVGRQLLERQHYLEVGSQSVIGSVTASGHAVVALDTSSNPVHRRNEFLPETRAEMALPLRVGQRIIGALDLQSKEPDAFGEQDVELFQGMADQLAIAIENAALFAESTAQLQEIERLNQSLTRTAWDEFERRHAPGSLSAAAGPARHDGDWTALQREAMRTGQIAAQTADDTVTFAVPIRLRGQTLGAVEWQVPAQHYTQDVRQTAIELTARLALTADNIRLFEQSRQVAQREALVNQISNKLVSTTDIDQILQTAVRELGLALHTPETAIQLITPDDDSGDK